MLHKTILILLLLAACHHPQPKQAVKPEIRYIHDTVYIQADTARYTAAIDSLKDELFVTRYKIERVKYYVAIVDRSPSQIKYLKGWIKRAIK